MPPSSALTLPSLMRLMWLSSPTLAVGGYSYSEGFEAAVEHGWIQNEDQAHQWICDQMHLSQARGDWSVVAQAVQAWQAQDEACLIDLNDWVLMTRESKEFRLQCLQMGRSLLLWLRAQKTCPLHDLETLAAWSEPTWPLVFALALHWSQADLPAALTALAFGWAENMTQTAMKTIPLGQTSGQNILSKLLQDIPLAVQTALDTPANERQLFTPHLSILSARHEHQYSRLFRS